MREVSKSGNPKGKMQKFPWKNKVINCFKKDNPLIQKKLREVSIEEGRIIATELFQILNKRKDGIGLAANQVGINAQVAVVNVREPLILINPKIIEKWDEIPFYEGCLSFPKQGIHTRRYKSIIIHTEQEESNWYFSGVECSQEARGSWEQEGKEQDKKQRLLEAICVQHEIDHLNGMTIMDRENKPKPILSKKSYGRNEIIGITNGDTYKEIKYKKAKPLLDGGEWVVYVGDPIT
jgi:peptide deformylase